MIDCIIVDDQPASIELLSAFIDKTEGIQVSASTSEPLSAIDYVSNHPEINLIFLDVEMPTITGFDFLAMIQQQSSVMPLVVLITGHSAYALDGYQFDRVIGFLHKVITYKKFIETVQKVERVLPIYQFGSTSNATKQVTTHKDSFFVKTCYNRKEQYVQLQFDDLLYVQSQRNYVSLITTSHTYSVRRPLQELMQMLPPTLFIRIHKSFVINLRHIQYIDTSCITLSGKHAVPISATYREEIMKKVQATLIKDK